MDSLHGTLLQVVLKVKKGKGFSFTSQHLVIIAVLDGKKLETNKILASEISSLNMELSWDVDKKYLRRLRKINTAIKIECFFAVNEQKHNKLGYILLNLRQAQIISLLSSDSECLTWHNFLGVPRKIQAFKPQLLLVFKIQEVSVVNECRDVVPSHIFKTLVVKNMDGNRNGNYLQIGPTDLCFKFYELSIDIIETGNLCSIVVPDEIGTPLNIQFHLMGMSLMTKEFCGFKGIVNKEKFKIKLKSEIEFLDAYFRQFPTLSFFLFCNEKVIGSGLMELRDLTDLREHFTGIAKKKILLKSIDGKDAHVIDCLCPFVDVNITLLPMLTANENSDVYQRVFSPLAINEHQYSTPSVPNVETEIVSYQEVIINGFPKEDIISGGLVPEIHLPEESEKPFAESVLPLHELESSNPETSPPRCETEASNQKSEIVQEQVKHKMSSVESSHFENRNQMHNNVACHHTSSPEQLTYTAEGILYSS